MTEELSKQNIQQNHPLNRIYFYLTEGCNLRCRHCWIAPKFQTEAQIYPALDFELFCSIIAQAKPLGLTGVKLTGGEPLLHPMIHDILEFIRQEDLQLTVETNGVLCAPELAKSLAKCKNPFVSVSLDGTNAKTHEWVRGVEGCFDKAIEGIKNLVKADFKPQIIMTIMRHNINQLEALVRLAESLGAGSVKFNIVQPTARGETMYQAGETLTIGELVQTGKWVEDALFSATTIKTFYSHPPAFRPLGKLFGENGDGCSVCGILGILGVLADGRYALCGIGKTIPELVFGHARQNRLEDIWNHTPILMELREGMPRRFEGVCKDCVMKARCLGNCVAQNYYKSRNLWAGYWYCEEARQHGLFPKTRIKNAI
jgi:SynChlorMet cassette radical SAM/SPASM protein ScmF